jgi:hypothetical protein
MFAAALSLLVAAFPAQPEKTNSPPRRPHERFTVYVEIAPEFASTSGESNERVLASVSEKIKKRKNWLFLTKAPDKAEVRVRILGHRVREEHVTSISSRVRDRPRWDDQGPPVDYVDENYVSERHYLQAGVTVLGRVRTLAGYDGKKKGANLDRAAATLAENLENSCLTVLYCIY